MRCPLPIPILFCNDVRSSQAHAFYSVPANYAAVTQPTLSSFYGVPQSYYVPSRIRKSYQTRLEATGLCTTPAEESEVEKPKRFGAEEKQKDDPKQTFKMAFQRERVGHSNTIDTPSASKLIWSQQVLEKSRAAFDLYARLLGDKSFFFYDRCAMRMRCARFPESRLTGTSQADDVGSIASSACPASPPRATPRHAAFVASQLVVSLAHLARTSRTQRRDAQRTRAPARAIQTKHASAVPKLPRMVG